MLHINSYDRETNSQSSSDFIINFQNGLKICNLDLESCYIPNVMYNVNSNNNTLIFTEAAGDLTCTLTNGSYTITQLRTELKTQLDAAGLETYTITYSNITNFLTITATGVFELKFALTGNLIYKLLGFSNLNTTSVNTHTGGNSVDLSYTNYIKLKIYGIYSNVKTSSHQDCTFIIPNNALSKGQFIEYHNLKDNTKISNFTSTNKNVYFLHIKLYDEYDNLVSLNGVDWSMILKLN